MKKQILTLAASLMAAVPALAEQITCMFTEPFISVQLNTNTGRGKIIDNSNEKTIRFKNKVATPLEHGVEEWRLTSGYTLVIDRNQPGSDGMSDYEYPFSAQLNENYGGCFTDKLPRKQVGEGI